MMFNLGKRGKERVKMGFAHDERYAMEEETIMKDVNNFSSECWQGKLSQYNQ